MSLLEAFSFHFNKKSVDILKGKLLFKIGKKLQLQGNFIIPGINF